MLPKKFVTTVLITQICRNIFIVTNCVLLWQIIWSQYNYFFCSEMGRSSAKLYILSNHVGIIYHIVIVSFFYHASIFIISIQQYPTTFLQVSYRISNYQFALAIKSVPNFLQYSFSIKYIQLYQRHFWDGFTGGDNT